LNTTASFEPQGKGYIISRLDSKDPLLDEVIAILMESKEPLTIPAFTETVRTRFQSRGKFVETPEKVQLRIHDRLQKLLVQGRVIKTPNREYQKNDRTMEAHSSNAKPIVRKPSRR
jgi:hypothetical protein